MVDGTIAEYQAAGPVYLQGGVFPNYRPLITNTHPPVQAAPSIAPSAQPVAPASAPAPTVPPSAPGQLVNPRLLIREQSQHAGQNVDRLTQDQVASTFLPPQNTIDPTQQQPIQQTPPRQQVVQPIQQTPPNPTSCATSAANTPNSTSCTTDSANAIEVAGCPADSAARFNERIGWVRNTWWSACSACCKSSCPRILRSSCTTRWHNYSSSYS